MAEELGTAGTALEPVKNMDDLPRVYHMVLYAAAFSVFLHPLVPNPHRAAATQRTCPPHNVRLHRYLGRFHDC